VRTGRLAEHVADGNRRPRSTGPIQGLYPAAQFDLRAGETAEIYLRLRTPMQFRVPLTLCAPDAYAEIAARNGRFALVCFGAFAMLCAMGVLFALFARDRGYLTYAFSMACMVLYFLGLTGYWRHLGWPGWRFATTNGTLVFNGLGIAALLVYLRWFFDLPTSMPRVDRGIRRLVWACAGLLVWVAFGSYRPRLVVVQLLDLAVGALALAVAIAAWRRGNRTARFYLLAWSAFWVLVLVEIAQQWKWLPVLTAPNVLPMAGLLLAFALFQAAMADRVRQLRLDKEEAQAQAGRDARERKSAGRPNAACGASWTRCRRPCACMRRIPRRARCSSTTASRTCSDTGPRTSARWTTGSNAPIRTRFAARGCGTGGKLARSVRKGAAWPNAKRGSSVETARRGTSSSPSPPWTTCG
jgi:hypothetical protein